MDYSVIIVERDDGSCVEFFELADGTTITVETHTQEAA